ncbi:LacI family transcriptional regulator [Acidaminobacter sp. JC074]|uniref:LacI family DNA-binding transcriptional regulator n=1 Tax=Acidaminobacter sp. JC074 TaxID=2530199 RepID=UPI001F0ED8CE|nr:LacI family DNA-binding transcriptional regulator [Acidaminobacter sp. JC074]MCH4889930.1 LacI family transcriptional regulator [Acidaminobacter sp. JC074]
MNINDIAKMAGVSKATVSRVLNGIKVKPEYKEKVDRVLLETGYKPNRLARELVSKKTKLIGVILPSLKPNVYSYIVEGMAKVLQDKGYSLIITTCDEFNVKEDDVIDLLDFFIDRHVEGIVYVPNIITEETKAYIDTYQLPMVTIGEKINGLPAVLFDDYNASKSIVDYLVKLGHESIGYIGIKDEYHSVGYLRRLGYMNGLKEAGIEIDESMMVTTGFEKNNGYVAAKDFIKSVGQVTAIFAGYDRMAYGIINYLTKVGYKVPEDISVIGIDDDDVSAYFTPSLTSVSFDYVKTGQVAANMIIDFIKENLDIKDQVIDFKIIERNSVI